MEDQTAEEQMRELQERAQWDPDLTRPISELAKYDREVFSRIIQVNNGWDIAMEALGGPPQWYHRLPLMRRLTYNRRMHGFMEEVKWICDEPVASISKLLTDHGVEISPSTKDLARAILTGHVERLEGIIATMSLDLDE